MEGLERWKSKSREKQEVVEKFKYVVHFSLNLWIRFCRNMQACSSNQLLKHQLHTGDSHRAGMKPSIRYSRPSILVASTAPFSASLAQHGAGLRMVNRRSSLQHMFDSELFILLGVSGGARGSSSMDTLDEHPLDESVPSTSSRKGSSFRNPTSTKHRLGMCHTSSYWTSCSPVYTDAMPRIRHFWQGCRR